MKVKTFAIISIFVFFVISSANATLIGDNVSASVSHNWFELRPMTSNIVVENAFEYRLYGGSWGYLANVNIEDSSIYVDWTYPQFVMGITQWLTFSDLDWTINPENYIDDISFSTNMSSINDNDFRFGDDWVSFNINGSWYGNKFLLVDLETAAPVPEPSTFLLLGGGLAGLGFFVRRRKKE